MGTKNNPGQFDCFDKIEPDEPFFVIRAKDPIGADVVRDWAVLASNGKHYEQAKIDEAVRCAAAMRDWRRKNIGPDA